MGSARVSQRLDANGGKTVELVMNIHQQTEDIEIRTLSTYDKDGRALRKVQRVTMQRANTWSQKIVEFSSHNAKIIEESGGKRKTRSVPLAENLSPTNASEMWFFRDKPKPNQVCKSWTFSLDSEAWEPTETTYLGKRADGHHLHSKQGSREIDVVVDDKGLPIRLEDNNGLLITRS